MPEILQSFPDAVYIVLGATHPNELRHHGDTYRQSLEALTKELGLDNSVKFHNQFVDSETLKQYIGAADLYLTPYLTEQQITSGTLSYAFGAGKAVISTPYWHAAELLASDKGVLVPFRDSAAVASAVVDLLGDDTRRHAIRKRAYKQGRDMIWSTVASLYQRSFEASRLEIAAKARKVPPSLQLPALQLGHLLRMTDSTGIFQHAICSVPNFSAGYCVDDNARALILAVELEKSDQDQVQALATTTAAFLLYAFDATTKRFRSHLGFDRHWLDTPASEDCHGRALWALGMATNRSTLRVLASQLFVQALPTVLDFTSPRAWAFCLLGIKEYLNCFGGDSQATQIRVILTEQLMSCFKACTKPDWQWFEDILTYDNAKLAHALLASDQPAAQACGLQALEWLVSFQTSEQGHFRPIGSNGFYRHNGPRADFDQQPIEAQSTISACLAAYRLTGTERWRDIAFRTFDWFFGGNDLGLPLYCPETGGCRDGLHVDRVNANQGAESTLAFWLSFAELRSIPLG
jgi:hypothetical protein